MVTTGTVGSITTSGATISGGSVNAESGSVTSIQFCYSTTSQTNCTGGTVSTVAGSNPTASGSSNTAETATLSGLTANTKYYFNLEATNLAGTVTYGTVANFTTSAPTVTATQVGAANNVGGNTSTLASASFSAPTGDLAVILVTYEDPGSQTCSSVADTSGTTPLTSITEVEHQVWWDDTSPTDDYGMCAWTAKGDSSTAGTVTVTMGSPTDNISIEVILLSGDSNATFATNYDTDSGTSSPATAKLTGTPAGDELFLGDAGSGTSTVPTWTAPTSFNVVGSAQTFTVHSGDEPYSADVFFGAAAGSVTAPLGGTSPHWGTIGVEITP